MKWGHFPSGRYELLFWVISCCLYPNRSVDHWIKDFIEEGGGIGGDPGWEISCVSDVQDGVHYRVWADSEMSGIEPDEAIYTIEEMRKALKESLLAFAEEYPEKLIEVKEVLERYKF
jgi:hypothetical protein